MLRLLHLVTKLVALFISGLAVLSAVSLLVLSAAPAAASAEPSPERQAELRNLLVQDCGSCHGLTLAGGLGPPIRAEDLRIKPVEYLAYTILNGRPGTAMPPWRPFLSDAEAVWLAQVLKAPAD